MKSQIVTSPEVTDLNNEYLSIQIKPNPDCHDRFIVLDYGVKTEKVFHCGASSKDAGKKGVCDQLNIEHGNSASSHRQIAIEPG